MKIFNKVFHKLKNLLIIICVLSAGLFAVHFALAQGTDNLLFGGVQNETGNALGLSEGGDPRIIIARIIRIFIGFLGVIAVGLIMYAGFLWMTSEGEADKVDRAKRTLRNAVIGLIIILSSFAIATFILNKLSGGITGGGPGPGGNPPPPGSGLGAIGSCTVESVYPAPNQKDVPRNTILMVTFKEDVDPATVCDDIAGNNNGVFCDGDPLIPYNVRLYKAVDGDACGSVPGPCAGNVTNVNVMATNSNRTFVFTPANYLGSPSEFIWYRMYLTGAIEKADKSGLNSSIFATCNPDYYFEWDFEVNNIIDLTPPQVKNSGVFPPPDNQQDTYSTTAATAAQGSITVGNQPQYYVAGQVNSVTNNGASPPAIATGDPNNQENGILVVTVLPDGITAQLAQQSTGNLLGSNTFSNNSVTFQGYFILTVTGGGQTAGDSWDVDVSPMVQADTLTVGSIVYTFVSGSAGVNEIIASGIIPTLTNIAAALDSRPDLIATVAGTAINLTAEVAGNAGNNIALAYNSPSSLNALTIALMGSIQLGQDAQTSQQTQDKKDQPKNSVIQINFNEAINPITVSGSAQQVQNAIAVKCVSAGGVPCNSALPEYFACGSDVCVDGKFVVSNQYRTVEFISNNLCGINGCGDKIYCLPGMSNLKVELMAAGLDGCGANCAAKAPFTNCAGGVCQDAGGINYPLSAFPYSGIMDAALNSLDGNRDGDADGPGNFYDENAQAGAGDDYRWSFWLSDLTNLTPPIITAISPAHTTPAVSLTVPITITFDKLLMSSSLRTGMVNVFNGVINIAHKAINLRNFSNKPTGYWVSKNDIDIAPLDGQPDITEATINHSMFYDSTSYRAQVGSAVKDIYQNCFKPSEGPGCNPSAPDESCCPVGATINPALVQPGQNCP